MTKGHQDGGTPVIDQETREQPHDENLERQNGLISRRNFLHGLAAAGATLAFFSSSTARAQFDLLQLFGAGELPDETMLAMFDRMLEIRWFERTLADKTVLGETRGYSGHYYAGQEAVAVGASTALRTDDYVLSTHRAHGHGLAKGVDMRDLIAEIYMKATGLNGGYGGTMHFADPTVGFLGADGIVGPSASFGTGAAYAIKVRGTDQVVLTYGGDGHWASPHFQSALNEAAVAKLPFIYLVENNTYLQYTHYRQITTLDDYTPLAHSMGIPSAVVDGQDVLGVYNAVSTAVERARSGDGPSFIEAKTYRYYVHSGAAGVTPGELGSFGPDPLLINIENRPQREVLAWMARDPIHIFRNTLIEFGMLDAAGADARDAAAQQKVAEAFAYADAAPVPSAEGGLDNVFANVRMPARHIVES
jgi:acetoin:2,6-dichlorophenolindophenol oxidoreductase subunit alpha